MQGTALLIPLIALVLIGLIWAARNDREIQRRRAERRMKKWA